jgi:hypothetical protein
VNSGRSDLRDADWVQQRCEQVLGQALYWFPVRHHSPAVARHVEAAILARRPKLVFLEGPAEAGSLVPHLVDSRTKPPVAIYSSYRDDDNVLGLAGIASPAADVPARFACWYPLMAYSPEYVTLLAAKKIGAQVVFIDLPHYAELKPAAEATAKANGGREPTDSPPQASPRRDDDRLLAESSFYQALAESAGYRSWNEAWDTLFEFGELGEDYEAFRRELAAFCCAARATSDPQRIEADGTLDRERFMLRTIRASLAGRRVRPEQALVVCGGFHLFLDQDDTTPPPAIPPGTVYTTVVPYSYFRVSELSGYAAGNRAPQFYQTAWDLARAGRGDDLLAEHVVATLHRARREGEPLSSADAISVSQHARMLASLRGRRRPVLDDIHDALITCCCKGDPADVGLHLRKAIDAADIGTKVGRVTSALGRLPIVDDFHRQIETAALDDSLASERRSLRSLDKRDERDVRRSTLLHRLAYLQIPFAVLIESPATEFATGTILREKWQLQWNPQVEPALVEQNLYGDTVEAAALARLREEVAQDELHAGRTCERLARALDMDLPDMVRQVEAACCRAMDAETRFVSLSQALHWLIVIDRYAVFRNLRREVLADLLLRCFDRACFAVPDVANVPEDQQQEVVAALLTVAETVLRDTAGVYDRQLFAQHVRSAAALSGVPFLRGVFLGMLTELRVMQPDELAAELGALAASPVERMVTAGDFLDGVMAVSRTSILLGADALIGAIDDLLRAADWETFLVMLPRMRAAFERLHARQVESLATRVAQRYGLSERESLTELRTSVAAAVWIARLDQQVAKIIEQWNF